MEHATGPPTPLVITNRENHTNITRELADPKQNQLCVIDSISRLGFMPTGGDDLSLLPSGRHSDLI